MGRYAEVDLGRVRSVSMRGSRRLVGSALLYHPPARLEGFRAFWDSLPPVLGAADLKAVVAAILRSRAAGRPVIALCGAHVLKTGMGPGLIRMLDRGLLTGIAFNGAGAIHDAELGIWGRTSEEVATELHTGRFGMSRETAAFVNGAAAAARAGREGFGEALGRLLLQTRRGIAERSVLAAAYRRGVPVTVHVAIGTDIVHQHADFDGAAAGEASARDFRILTAQVLDIAGGTVLNLGSAVILPEVFLKSFSIARNLGAPTGGLTTAAFDFIRHYRPQENIVRRPTMKGGKGYYLVGQHEILLPLLFHACLSGFGGSPKKPVRTRNKPLKSQSLASERSSGRLRAAR
jgi:hypothetical protein